ncbi:hypothetical protein Tco_0631276 [Tanacetum coccineum]
MMTYLKHVGNYKHAELKIKKFEEVQALYEKIKRSDEDFISIGSAEDATVIKRNDREELVIKSESIKGRKQRRSSGEDKDEEMYEKKKNWLVTPLAFCGEEWLVHNQTVHVAEKTKLLLKKDRVYKFKKWYECLDTSSMH